MARSRRKSRKNDEQVLTVDNISTVIADAISNELEPVKRKLDDIESRVNDKNDGSTQIDEEDIKEIGLESPEELQNILDQAVDIAADNLEEDGNAVAAAVIDSGLDASDVVEELVKRRKARKSAGETLDAATVQEIAEVVGEVAEDIAQNMDSNEVQALVDEGVLDEKTAEEEVEKRRKGRKSKPTGSNREQKRASVPPVQRKYQSIYMSGRNRAGEASTQRKQLPAVIRFARAVKCSDIFAQGNIGGFKDPERAAFAAKKFYNDAELEREFKSMSVSSPSSGGFLVPQSYVDDVVEMLYNQTVIFELGAQKMPMPHGNLNIPRQTSGARAYFGGEARPIKGYQPTFNMLHLSSKRLQALVVLTEELLRSTEASSDKIFGNDLLMKMKLGIEYGGLLAKGTDFEPLGLMNNPSVEKINLLTINDTQIADAQGRPTADLPLFMRGTVLSKDVHGTNFGWTFNSDTEQYLMRLKSTDGKFIWLDEMKTGTFCMAPYRTTNMIPTNQTTGRSSIIFGEWSDLIVGEQFGLETRTTYDATVNTDQGAVSTFETVQTATRATSYIDIGCRHEESFVIATNVKVIG